ncbi:MULTISPECIES: NAD-dependent succinate-semialdehyde dehydrogenase [Mesorhizobium]|uniref:NAD-dependent succinate-semialdehyde dehydrogenase n=1 Tax=Rhizobium loti TaxID=381 RepID=A0A6M7TSB3_RHILI|nr:MULTISPECIES: NAD-dependent succinate-semialdehyde dehydrogenase [Mesorhizobium]KRB26001.1 NAD-dependent succinate-semialdehyde dehydrogenase [Mesorhizobium sp. Root172]OBQ64815.1 NAD-dependent succinate-semialdehyde dehydrogenase [Mesorhizobium loti]QKC67911.1 NAD-dependent succinate-semialdehyde dehydrogenase [Mesorhizobium loti]
MYPDVRLHIDGSWRPARGGRTMPVINPATEAELGSLAHAGIDDLDEALAAAAKGFDAWRRVSPFDRSRLMRKAADILRERNEHIATLMTLEQGKPIAESRMEAFAAADIIDWFAEEARRAYGRIVPARLEGVSQSVVKEPVGPVAAFTPWNFPLNQAVRKLSAALAAGCSIIIKGPEETPASPAELVRAFVDAGLPDGVLNLVYGTPSEISAYLIPHPVIRKISFTGSTPVGKQLASLAGLHMKRATMELGGHAPVIVLPDADLDRAARVMVASKFRNAGQICVAPTRFLVDRAVYDDFVGRFAEATSRIKVGDGFAEGTTMGPLANPRRVQAMEELVHDAVQKGAELVTGGKRIGNSGYFFEPTILSGVGTDARAMNEEPFGPLALMTPVSGLDEALAEANRLNYGLAAYGFTRSAASAAKMSSGIASGMVSINHYGLALPEVPFGGINDSGNGTEGGTDALESYLNSKFVSHLQVD